VVLEAETYEPVIYEPVVFGNCFKTCEIFSWGMNRPPSQNAIQLLNNLYSVTHSVFSEPDSVPAKPGVHAAESHSFFLSSCIL